MHDGKLRHDGDTVEAMSVYHDLLGSPRALDDESAPDLGPAVGRQAAVLEGIELRGPDGEATRHVETGSDVVVEATIRFQQPVENPLFGLVVVSEGGVQVYGEHWPLEELLGRTSFAAGDTFDIRAAFPAELPTGSYTIQLGLATAEERRLAGVPEPILFFSTGRRTVRGVADLRARLSKR